ncbi:Glycosyl transferase group 1 [Candidatus Filomicrobium marinum]|uniref:Glycosyl transferase group 1 n=1 Tax=Candidatus Filomicrobium marinum TaxID=1608628 RepID=A0A0D6JF65_9HYPH|nr:MULTISPECIES: glycosyltransferase [Filomicrobium]MCV0370277.1 glycosyltransferase [Filomicrobium sp.]CFX22936.1 Glycosyl transferase group 1 [Candidatus Filomicrobium marinum]CPR18976.1 Glycosyl transferase group 1 [Candidatus Filomicrobium marinum]
MRVLIAHNQYQQLGGEDIVAENECAMLRRAGHSVQLETISNDSISGTMAKLAAARRVSYNPAGREWMAERIATFQPDIVQVHNVFPLLTPAVYDACAEAGVPVVQTLHNFRVSCAGGFFLRDNKVCEKCLGGSPYWAVRHRCYRGSLLGSLAVAHMIDSHQRAGTWSKKVDLYFALSDFAKSRFIAAGLPAERIVVKPNFAIDPGPASHGSRNGALFVGRLSEEKGVRDLVAAWVGIDVPLRICGDGPLREELETQARGNITFVGRIGSDEVRREMARAQFLIIPSIYYENFPMVIAEAYASGLPVLASRIGSLAEIVRHGETGHLFAPGDPIDMQTEVLAALSAPDTLAGMGQRAREIFEREYSEAAVCDLMTSTYARLVTAAQNKKCRIAGVAS